MVENFKNWSFTTDSLRTTTLENKPNFFTEESDYSNY